MENDSVVGRYKIRDFLREKGLTIVPCVNPDGVEIAIHGSDAALKYKALVEKPLKKTKSGRQTQGVWTLTTTSTQVGTSLKTVN